MSWWVSIEPAHPTPELELNITYNVGTMLRRAGIHPNVLNGMKVSEAFSIIKNAMMVMRDNKTYFEQYDAHNGWGTYATTFTAVKRLFEALDNANDDDILRWQ